MNSLLEIWNLIPYELVMRNIETIIKDAGGARKISEASGPADEAGKRPLTYDAVYKWSKIGIPDRHWPLVMSLIETSAEELHGANCAARSVDATEVVQ
jgi:hypothetical protein